MKTVKTTFLIPDHLMRHLKEMSAQQRCTLSSLVEAALRLLLENNKKPKNKKHAFNLPSWDMGKAKVDLSDRDALYDLMES